MPFSSAKARYCFTCMKHKFGKTSKGGEKCWTVEEGIAFWVRKNKQHERWLFATSIVLFFCLNLYIFRLGKKRNWNQKEAPVEFKTHFFSGERKGWRFSRYKYVFPIGKRVHASLKLHCFHPPPLEKLFPSKKVYCGWFIYYYTCYYGCHFP